jgi:hypothetical protein
MKQHRAMIQCQEKAVVVTSPSGNRISIEVAVQAQSTGPSHLDNMTHG